VSGTFGECGKDVAKGLYVRIDDVKFQNYLKSIIQKTDNIIGE